MSWLTKGTKKIVSPDGVATETKWEAIEKWSNGLSETEKQNLLKTLPDVKKSSN